MEKVIRYLLDRVPVSAATLHNWQKEGLLPPFPGEPVSSDLDHYLQLTRRVAEKRLSSRANRCADKRVPAVCLSESHPELKNPIRCALSFCRSNGLSAESAVRAAAAVLLAQKGWVNPEKKFENCLRHFFPQNRIGKLALSWIYPLSEEQIGFCRYLNRFDIPLKGDFLGNLYQSLLSVSRRTCSGLYYTPVSAVPLSKAVGDEETVYDPCCGTGALLMAILPPGSDDESVYASDTDETALRLCEINLSLFFDNPDIRSHIFVRNALEERPLPQRFDVILTNPPWGARVDPVLRMKLKQRWSFADKCDSFALILLQMISFVKEGGRWYFFLPESFLTVRKHRFVRRIAAESSSSLTIRLLGNVFPGVLSQAVFLEGIRRPSGEAGPDALSLTVVPEKGNSFSAPAPVAPDYLFEAFSDPSRLQLRNRLYEVPHLLLGEVCGFILGIVTGDNARVISTVPSENAEPVYRGCDILPYRFKKPARWMRFDAGQMRQCADESLYRKPKIVYRFIGERLICHYDQSGALILNSANALYPKENRYPAETLICLLNSCIFNFILRSRFHSRKILRSHLEILPLPLLPDAQHERFRVLYGRLKQCRLPDFEIESQIESAAAAVFQLSSQDLFFCRSLLKGRED